MHSLIEIFRTENDNGFYIAQRMVQVLYKILTVENKDEIKFSATMLAKPKFITAVQCMFSLSKENPACRSAMVNLNKVFSGRYIGLASMHEAAVNEKIVLFRKKIPITLESYKH